MLTRPGGGPGWAAGTTAPRAQASRLASGALERVKRPSGSA